MAEDPSKGDTPSPLPTESTSTSTREGSFTPQWLQPKGGVGGRTRLGDTERQPDSARRGRSESLGGNEGLTKGDRLRPSKWAPDDRETWKPKERWATGPDSSKRWLDVQTTGRQKQGWAMDGIGRGHTDRWNTEGGRWTEDRKQDDKDYVPKNARWNDEERTERWRTAGRGESISRGRGMRPGTINRVTMCDVDVGVNRRSNSDGHFLGEELNGIHDFNRAVNGHRHQYTKKQLLDVYDQLHKRMGPRLMLPRGVDTSYQMLFRDDRQLVVEDDLKVEIEKPTTENVDGITAEELEADSWIYKDPGGKVQGPFSKQEVLAWWEEGYFPEDLPVQSQLSAKENWVPLEKLLQLWKVPVQENTEVPARKLEGCDSLATVGSHISSSLLPDVNIEEEAVSQPTDIPSLLPLSPQPQPQPSGFPNPVSDLQQHMQNLLLRQKQSQNVGGLDFTGAPLGSAGLTGLRPGMSYQPNNPYMGVYGMQQRPTSLQDNSALTPAILEALQQRFNQQQMLSRAQMQPTPYTSFDMNSGMNAGLTTGLNQMQNPLQANLAALMNQSQMVQRTPDQRQATASDLQRLMQARSMQAGGFGNNPLAGVYGQGLNAGLRPFLPQPSQQQNPWGSGNYSALNSLLQRPQQQMNQQQLTQQMLLNKLQAMRFPNQQMANRPSLQTRDHLLSLGLQTGDASLVDGLMQHRQRNNMSPQNIGFQSGLESGYSLMSQTSMAPMSSSAQLPFPQQILHPKHEIPGVGTPPPMLSLDPTTDGSLVNESKISPIPEQPSKTNAWGIPPSSAATSLLEIQEQESRNQQSQTKERQVTPPPASHTAGGWNVPHVQPTSLVDIMQEDESKRQAQVAVHSKQPSNHIHQKSFSTFWQRMKVERRQGSVWSKKTTARSQSVSGGESGKGSTTEHSIKEAPKEEGVVTSGPPGNRDLDNSQEVGESEAVLFSGQLKISQQFRDWCKTNMIELGGSGDIALIEFLLSFKSRSEIAEYTQEYFKGAASDKLSLFISEFLKRKDGDLNQIKRERSGQKSKKKTSKAKDVNKSSHRTNDSELLTSGVSEPLESGSGKASRTRDGKSKPKAKKQAKGQHIPADMLGFKSNVNFETLYRGNSHG